VEDRPTATAPDQEKAEEPKPTSPPATEPAKEEEPAKTQPASSFNPRPPYTVKLFVNDPEEDKQPGWLNVQKLDDEGTARVVGKFPSQNVMELETDNVQRLRIDVGFLPLRKNKRTILRIDEQSLVITSPHEQKYITMRRNANGRWVPVD
jgi:hypothetical protein